MKGSTGQNSAICRSLAVQCPGHIRVAWGPGPGDEGRALKEGGADVVDAW